MTYYFISLGTNIQPEQNILKMMDALFELSPTIDASSILKTAPVGLDSNHYFLNVVVRIFYSGTASELKKQLVRVEENLGRDRSDPNSKWKDRPADLDILFSMTDRQQKVDSTQLPTESYVLPSVIELFRFLDIPTKESLSIKQEQIALTYKNKTIGQQPIRLQRSSRSALATS